MRKFDPRFTNKQLAFVDAYMICEDGQQAAIQAGYTKNGASRMSTQCLSLTHVQEEIAYRQNILVVSTNITKEMIIQDLMEIKTNTMTLRSANGYKCALKAIEVINKMLGFNAVEKTELTVSQGINWNETKTYLDITPAPGLIGDGVNPDILRELSILRGSQGTIGQIGDQGLMQDDQFGLLREPSLLSPPTDTTSVEYPDITNVDGITNVDN